MIESMSAQNCFNVREALRKLAERATFGCCTEAEPVGAA